MTARGRATRALAACGVLLAACVGDDLARVGVGEAVTLPVAPGAPARVALAADAGSAVVLAVAQRGVDVAVSVSDPAGAERFRVDWTAGREGAEPVAFTADAAGAWLVTVEAGAHEPPAEVVVRWTAEGPDDAAIVAAHAALRRGRDAERRGDGASLDAARVALDEARAAFARLGDRVGEALATDLLGDVTKTLGDRAGAIPLRERALALFEAAGDRAGVATSALGLANLRDWFGDIDASLALYGRALAAARAVGDARTAAIVTTDIAMTHDDLGDYPRALAGYREALAAQEALGDDHGAAFSHQGLGACYRRLGDAERAEAHIRAALALRERLGETRWAAGDHYALGLVRLDLEGDPLGAVEQLETALRLRAGLGYFSDRDPQVRVALGRAQAALGLAREAAATLEEARAELLALGVGAGDADLALGDAALAADDPAAALVAYRRAAADPGAATLLRNSLRAEGGEARALFALGDADGARAAAEAALERVETVREGLGEGLLRGTWLGAWRGLCDLLVAIDLDGGPEPDVPRAFADHERGLARALLDALHPDVRGAPGADLAAVRGALAADQALVSLVLADDGGRAFVLTRDGARVVKLPPRDDVLAAADALVTAVTARAHGPEGEPTAARRARVAAADARAPALAEALSELLWRPLGELPARVVLVAGDPALEAVPFELLPDADGAPAIERHRLTQAPSAATWLALGLRGAGGGRGAVVVADPVFGAGDARLAPDLPAPAAAFARLRFSGVEADAVAGALGVERPLTGLAASRQALLGADSPLAGAALVHLASHVLVDPVDPDRSGVVLSLVDPAGAPVDGLLTARDVRALPLRADLVVVSGCESALGRAVRGEGVMGLARAFLEAGARRVLASRWRVHDRGTAELMRHLYAALRGGADPEAALRDAALALRADPRFAAPYYWAAFTLTGP